MRPSLTGFALLALALGGCPAGSERADAGADLSGDAAPEITLAPKVDYPVGSDPAALSVADVDGDKVLDVAVALSDSLSGRAAVLLGKGGGALGAATMYRSGDTPYAVTLADVNGDRLPDLVLADYLGKSASVHLNQGRGTFGPRLGSPCGAHPLAVLAEDLTGDGRRELLLANQVGRSISVLGSALGGPADGTFPERTDIDVGEIIAGMAGADVDGDRDLDLLIAGERGLIWMLGQGGRFTRGGQTAIAGQPAAIAAGDLDGDGRPDAVLVDRERGEVTVLRGPGFAEAPAQQAGPEPVAAAIGDLDGDGRADLVLASRAGVARVLRGRGDGTLAPPREFPAGAGAAAVALADLDGDGALDVLVANRQAGTISVLRGSVLRDQGR
jgi:hypothetical protein